MESLKKIISEKKFQRSNKQSGNINNKTTTSTSKALNSSDKSNLSAPTIALSAIPLTQSEIIFRLRKLKQPAIFFGETIQDQYQRLKDSELKLIEERKLLGSSEIDLDKVEESLEGDKSIYWNSEYLEQGKECQSYEDRGLV